MSVKRYRKENQESPTKLPSISVYVTHKSGKWVGKCTLSSEMSRCVSQWLTFYDDEVSGAIFDGRQLSVLDLKRVRPKDFGTISTLDISNGSFSNFDFLTLSGHLWEVSPRTLAFGYLPGTRAKIIETFSAVRPLAGFPPGLLPICAAYLIEEVIAIAGVRGITVLTAGEKMLVWEYHHSIGVKPRMCFGADGTLNVLPIYGAILCVSSNGERCWPPWSYARRYRWNHWGGIAADERGHTYVATDTTLISFAPDGTEAWSMENWFRLITDLAYDAHSGFLLVAEAVPLHSDITLRIHVLSPDGQCMFYRDTYNSATSQFSLATLAFKP